MESILNIDPFLKSTCSSPPPMLSEEDTLGPISFNLSSQSPPLSVDPAPTPGSPQNSTHSKNSGTPAETPRTSQHAMSLHPLLWRLEHLESLHVSVELVSTPQPLVNDSPYYGSVDWLRLKRVHSAIKRRSPEPWLGKLILDTIDSFFVRGRGKFCFLSDRLNHRHATPIIHINNSSHLLFPKLIVRTESGFPFLLYNPPKITANLRAKFPTTRAGRRAGAPAHYSDPDSNPNFISPYDVACMLALAQEQLEVLDFYQLPVPETLKVYYILKMGPYTMPAVWLFTAEVPVAYVVALQERGVEGWVKIKQEMVEIPEVVKGDVCEGRLVDVFTEMLWDAMDMEDALREARGLEDEEWISVVGGEGGEAVGCKRAGEGDGEGDEGRVKRVKVGDGEGSTAEDFDDLSEGFTTEDFTTESTGKSPMTGDLATQSFMSEDFLFNDLEDEDFTDEDLVAGSFATDDLAGEDFTDKDLVAGSFTTEGLADEDHLTENLATENLATENLATESSTTENLAT